MPANTAASESDGKPAREPGGDETIRKATVGNPVRTQAIVREAKALGIAISGARTLQKSLQPKLFAPCSNLNK